MCYSAPDVLDALLSHLTDQMATYIKYQIDSGAQCVQVSWAPTRHQFRAGAWLHAPCRTALYLTR